MSRTYRDKSDYDAGPRPSRKSAKRARHRAERSIARRSVRCVTRTAVRPARKGH